MKPKILVVGDVMLDRYIHGVVERISPEAPIPILQYNKTWEIPGGAANVAMNLASLGAEVTLVGVAGSDCQLDFYLHEAGITRSLIPGVLGPEARTTVKERFVCSGHQLLRVDHDGTRPNERAVADIESHVRDSLPGAKALVLSDYAGGVLDRAADLISIAMAAGVPVYVDPKGIYWAKYSGATLIKPNEAELRAVVGDWKDAGDMQLRALRLLAKLHIASMLVTHGAGGMTLLHNYTDRASDILHGDYRHRSAVSGPVVDVTGAGDTVLAVVAYLLSIGEPWPRVLDRAVNGAAAVCARHGTSVVTRPDLGMREPLRGFGEDVNVTAESLA